MADREKVIATIQNRINEARNNHTKVATIFISTLSSVLELLKEQEQVQAEVEGSAGSWWYVCGECHGAIDVRDSFCRHCGRRISWKGCAL